MIQLNEKIIVVTGGSGLLGSSILENLERHEAKVVNLDIEESEVSIGEFIPTDITDFKCLKETVNTIISRYGTIDGLVNNAYPRTEDWGIDFLEDRFLESWRKNLDIQLNSYVACCQAVIPQMQKQQNGAIVNMASIYGVVANDFTLYENIDLKTAAPYSAIKGGLINFTRYLASLYGKFQIRVNCISPGGIHDNQNPVFVERYENKVPLNRMGRPDDISPCVTFLLSDAANYITGQNLIIDGGWTCL